jgi:hypothetical protein
MNVACGDSRRPGHARNETFCHHRSTRMSLPSVSDQLALMQTTSVIISDSNWPTEKKVNFTLYYSQGKLDMLPSGRWNFDLGAS